MVLDIALEDGKVVAAAEASNRQGIPHRYLAPTFNRLVASGYLQGVRGPKGGYRLAREPSNVTLAAILEAATPDTEKSDREASSHSAHRVVAELIAGLKAKWLEDLAAITLADLIKRAKETFRQPAAVTALIEDQPMNRSASEARSGNRFPEHPRK